MGGSDGESSGDGGTARFTRVRKATATKDRNSKNFENALRHALDGGSSSDEGPACVVDPSGPSPAKTIEPASSSKGSDAQVNPDEGADFIVHNEPPKPRKRTAPKPRPAKKAGDFLASLKAAEEEKKLDPEEEIAAALKHLEKHNSDGTRKKFMRKKDGPRSRVINDVKGDDSSEDGEGRFRNRIKGGGVGIPRSEMGKGKTSSQRLESDDEAVEPDLERVAAWKEELEKHKDAGSDDLRTAFSIKQCSPIALRKLATTSFLGNKKMEDGGQPLFDDEGKVNLHFLLGTYRSSLMQIQRRKKGDKTAETVGDDDMNYVRWLVRQARQLNLVNTVEMKRGNIRSKRMETIKKSGLFSLVLEANSADAEAPEDEIAETPAFADMKFPERMVAKQRADGELEGRLRSKLATRQGDITVSSSHGEDLQKVQDLLTAPTLSYDWEAKDDDEEEGGLEVDIPDSQKAESKRDVFRDHLKRAVSFHQAKTLAKKHSTISGLSRTFSSQSVGSNSAAPDREESTAAREETNNVAANVEADKVDAMDVDLVDSSAVDANISGLDDVPDMDPTPAGSPVDGDGDDTNPRETTDGSDTLNVGTDCVAPASAQPVSTLSDEVNDLEGKFDREISKVADVISTVDPVLAATQPWADDITPTAIWGDCPSPAPAIGVAADTATVGEHRPAVSPTAPFVVEEETRPCISPTAPFVPNVDGNAAISPTAPFVLNEERVAEVAHENIISPTAPFMPEVRQAAVSPTAPFALESSAGEPAGVSPTAPFPPGDVSSPTTGGAVDAEKDKQSEGLVDARSSAAHAMDGVPRPLKRTASAVSEDTASDSGAMDSGELLEQDKDNDLAPRSEQEEKRRKKETEWLRHKRKAEQKKAQGQEVRAHGHEDEDTALFGAASKAVQRKPSFLRMNSGLSGRK